MNGRQEKQRVRVLGGKGALSSREASCLLPLQADAAEGGGGGFRSGKLTAA